MGETSIIICVHHPQAQCAAHRRLNSLEACAWVAIMLKMGCLCRQRLLLTAYNSSVTTVQRTR